MERDVHSETNQPHLQAQRPRDIEENPGDDGGGGVVDPRPKLTINITQPEPFARLEPMEY